MARILVIDDDKDVRTLILYELKAHGHDVAVAADGAQGLALQRASPAQVVVTDIVVAAELGVAVLLQKPFLTRELLACIETALGPH